MASSLISGAIAILLILIAGYVVASGVLSIAETSIETQKDVKNNDLKILQSKVSILYADVVTTPGTLVIGVANNGTTSFGMNDFSRIDLFIGSGTGAGSQITRHSGSGVIVPYSDQVNRGMWDEGEILNLSVSWSETPPWIKVVVPTGVSSSYQV
jgi:ABC-type transport system involved in multi-copper enzyme maturation permease subunit